MSQVSRLRCSIDDRHVVCGGSSTKQHSNRETDFPRHEPWVLGGRCIWVRQRASEMPHQWGYITRLISWATESGNSGSLTCRPQRRRFTSPRRDRSPSACKQHANIAVSGHGSRLRPAGVPSLAKLQGRVGVVISERQGREWHRRGLTGPAGS